MSADDEWDPLRLGLKRILLRANARLEPEPQRAAAAWLADQLEALATPAQASGLGGARGRGVHGG